MVIRFHYNRQQAANGKPWTLHTSKGCFSAAHVVFETPLETEEKPEKKQNPRYFLKCNGRIVWYGNTAVVRRTYGRG